MNTTTVPSLLIALLTIALISSSSSKCPTAWAFSHARQRSSLLQLARATKNNNNGNKNNKNNNKNNNNHGGIHTIVPTTSYYRRGGGLSFSKLSDDTQKIIPLQQQQQQQQQTKPFPSDMNEDHFATNNNNNNDELGSSNGVQINNNNNNQNNNNNNIKERTLGILILLTVPLAWGTYTPVVKYMYDVMDPSMPGFVFSAGYYLVASCSLGLLSLVNSGSNNSQQQQSSLQPTIDNIIDNDNVVIVDDNDVGGVRDVEEKEVIARGGWELGSYLFIGNGLQVIGLQTVPADRAGEDTCYFCVL